MQNLFYFLDYISINKIDLKKLKSIIKGIVNGCKQSDCELVGGETAEMPGLMKKVNLILLVLQLVWLVKIKF